METKTTVALNHDTEIEVALPGGVLAYVTLEGDGINRKLMVRDGDGLQVMGADLAVFN